MELDGAAAFPSDPAALAQLGSSDSDSDCEAGGGRNAGGAGGLQVELTDEEVDTWYCSSEREEQEERFERWISIGDVASVQVGLRLYLAPGCPRNGCACWHREAGRPCFMLQAQPLRYPAPT